jgi:hypothetical protein
MPPSDREPFLICAEELHNFLLEAFRLGNQIRYKFMKGLRAMDDGGFYQLYSCSNVVQYSQMYFGYGKTLTEDLIRVAEKLEALPLCVAAFESGELCWSSLKEITRVAIPGTEKAWLDLARGRSSHDVKLEVEAAVLADRHEPRKNPYGLPGIKLDMDFQFAPEQYDLVEKALRKVAGEIEGPLGGKRPSPEAALLYLAQRIMETDPVASDRAEKKGAPATIVYRHCPACRISHVIMKDGPMEVVPEVIERMEAEADKVVISPEEELGPEAIQEVRARAARAAEGAPGAARPSEPSSEEAQPEAESTLLEAEGDMPGAEGTVPNPEGTVPKSERDKPNTPALTRRILLRDNNVCTNTFCGRRAGLTAHHIVFRSRGGKTAIYNEISLCRCCHALAHTGLLRITSTEVGEVRFEARADKCRLDLAALREKVASAPVVVVADSQRRGGLAPARAGAPCPPEGSTSASPPAGSPGAAGSPGPGGAAAAGGNPAQPEVSGSALPGRPGGGIPAAVGCLEPARAGVTGAAPTSSRDCRDPSCGKNWRDPVLEPFVRALRSLGYRQDEARERVQEAAEHFQSLGVAAKEEQILKRALMHRRLREKAAGVLSGNISTDAREAARVATTKATTTTAAAATA